MRVKISIVISFAVVVGPAVGQEQQTACIGILDRVNYNFLKKSSSDQQYALTKANLCSAEYDVATEAQKANIDASYKLFSGAGGASREQIKERQKSECSGHYGEHWYRQANLSEQRIAVTEALDTVSKCIALSQSKNLKISTVISGDNKQIDFVLRWKDGTPLKVHYAGPQPWDDLKCYVNGIGVAGPGDLSASIAPVAEWAFSCKREVTDEDIGGEKVKCMKPFNVVINTDKVSESIPVPRYCDRDYNLSMADKIQQTVDELSGDIRSTRSELANLSKAVARIFPKINEQLAKFSNWGDQVHEKYNGASTDGVWGHSHKIVGLGGSCDNGAFVTGIQTGTSRNLPNQINYMCRKLPILTISP
jgi:hypothetical protein